MVTITISNRKVTPIGLGGQMLRTARKLAVIAMIVAASTALVPGAAQARNVQPPTPPTKIWFDPTTHPQPHALRGPSTVTPLASGGGCNPDSDQSTCISWDGRELNSDFYINSWNNPDPNGTAYLYVDINGTTHYGYTALSNHLGHYPVWQIQTPKGTSGWAYTIVDYYDRNGNYIRTGYSPNQYWP